MERARPAGCDAPAGGFDRWERHATYAVAALLLVLFVLLNVQSALLMLTKDYNRAEWLDALAAMQWIRETTPGESSFLAVGYSNSVLIEWMPHLARRTVLNVKQGSEWEPAQKQRLQIARAVENCLNLRCVMDRANGDLGYNQIYILVDNPRLSRLLANTDEDEAAHFQYESLFVNGTLTVGRLSLLPDS